MPLAFVVLGLALSVPPPVVIDQSTEAPGTARLCRSNTVTLYAVGRGLLKNHFWPSPPLFTRWSGGPGGSVPPPPPPHARVNNPTPSAHSRFQRTTTIDRLPVLANVRATVGMNRTRRPGRSSRRREPRPAPRRHSLLEPEKLPADLSTSVATAAVGP